MKILTNKQYRDLLLKSTKGVFGAVTDDMLLRNNAFINEENKHLQERINQAIEYLDKEFPWEDGQPEDIYKILKGENNE